MTNAGEVWRLGRRPSLDGLRGVAALMVMACHFGEPAGAIFTSFGHNGVTVFFTLSGFLITALLLEERDRTGRVALLAFYARRSRRLLPALYVFVAVALVAGAVFGPTFVSPRDAALACLYVGNWSLAWQHPIGELVHTWSLAVEEQFYALWPLVLIVVLRRRSERTLFAVAAAGAVVSIGLRVFLWFHATPDRVYFGSDTHADALLIGCCVAIAMRRSKPRSVPPAVPYVLVGLVLALGFTTDEPTRYVILPTVVAVLTASLLMAVTSGESEAFTNRALVWVGRRSYGLYLWHKLILACMLALGASWPLTWMVALVGSVVVAEVSWRCVEAPFLRRRVPLQLGEERDPVERRVGGAASLDFDSAVRVDHDTTKYPVRHYGVDAILAGSVAGGERERD